MNNILECKYCKKECKNENSLRNHERMCKQNPNHQESAFIAYNKKKTTGEIKVWNKGLTKETDERVAKSVASRNKYYETHNGSWLGKTHTEEEKQKISKSRKKYLEEHPDQVPYLLNHSSKQSYPERYFQALFIKEQMDLKYHLQVNLYELDFYNEEKKLDIEIDGEQHYTDKKMPEHDKIRNEYLENLGWTIYRIRWSEYKSKTNEEKVKIINQIKDLLK